MSEFAVLTCGAFVLAIVLHFGFGLDAAWYWWGLLGVGIGLVKAA